MATHYHRMTGDTLHARTGSTAKPGHTLARPGYCLEEDANPSVKARQHAHIACSLAQALITRPQRHTGGYDDARQERRIDSTESSTPQPPFLDKMPHALIINVAHDHQAFKRLQKDRSILEIPQREFSDDTLMHTHLVALKQIDQNRLSFPQVIDPDVRINEDSHARCRLRGAASAAESLPPSAASCRPLSMRTRSSTVASRIVV